MSNLNPYTYLKFNIKGEILDCLYKPTEERMFNRLKHIIVKNSVRIGASHASFMYKGENYSCDMNQILPKPRNQLHNDYVFFMDEYLIEFEEYAQEKPIVNAYLTRMLNFVNYVEDVPKLLPLPLHGPIKKYSLLSPCLTEDYNRTDKFLLENKEYLRLIKRRLATNLITN